MEFEYDPAKSAANLDTHGIDFEAAKALWDDEGRIWGPAEHPVEDRFMAIGRIGGSVWAAIYTMRSDRIRLISVRRAKRKERAKYVRAKDGGGADNG